MGRRAGEERDLMGFEKREELGEMRRMEEQGERARLGL